VKKNTEFFTTTNPETLVHEIGGYLQQLNHTCVLDNKKYKFKVTLSPSEELGAEQ
jgi:hypothetical protein